MMLVWIPGVLAIGLAAIWIRRDYLQWTALGPGGLPHSAPGWLAMAFLRLLKRDGRRTDRLTRALASPEDARYLGHVVRRSGQRPCVAPHPVPQRQLSDTISGDGLRHLQQVFDEEVQAHGGHVLYQQSFFERHHEAITLHHPQCGHVYALVSHGEVAHIHPSDGSMHMVLSPSDASEVVGQEWGELHSLAGFMNRLPVSYTFVYAPRNDADLEMVRRMLAASVAFMTKGAASRS